MKPTRKKDVEKEAIGQRNNHCWLKFSFKLEDMQTHIENARKRKTKERKLEEERVRCSVILSYQEKN